MDEYEYILRRDVYHNTKVKNSLFRMDTYTKYGLTVHFPEGWTCPGSSDPIPLQPRRGYLSVQLPPSRILAIAHKKTDLKRMSPL